MQLASALADIPDAASSPTLFATSSAQASPIIRWRFNAEYGAASRPALIDVARARSSNGASDSSGSLTCCDLREEPPPNILYCWND